MSKRILLVPFEQICNLGDALILKDVCLIPCLLQKYHGYDATIAAYYISEVLHTHFPDCKVQLINVTGNYRKDAANFISQYAAEYDILYFVGAYEFYLNIALIYKQNNPGGKIYLKLDMNRFWLSWVTSTPYFRPLLNMCDLISTETVNLHRTISQILPYNIEVIPNGYYETFPSDPLHFSEKENIILTVGRLGIPEKQTDTLLRAFLDAEIPGWKLRLVGPVAEHFLPLLKTFQEHLNFSAVEFAGPIFDRKKLDAEYRRAKVFCLTSMVEACAHVFAEAAHNGCFIISTDVEGAYDITGNEFYGKVVPAGDHGAITRVLEKVCFDENLLEKVFEELSLYASTAWSWKHIISKLDSLFHLKGLVK